MTSWPGATYDAENQLVYLAYGPQVYAINAVNGTEKWRFPSEADNKINFYAAPAVDEQLVVGGYNHVLYGLNLDAGAEQWSFSEAKKPFVGGALVAGERIFAPNADGYLYALDKSGTLLWQFESQRELWATPVVDGQRVYLAGMDHSLYAVDIESGTQVWKTEDLKGSIAGTPTLSPEGVLYAGTFGAEMLAVDVNDGSLLWRVPTSSWVWSSPALVEGVLYFSDLQGTGYAVNASDGAIIWQQQLEIAAKRAIPGTPLVLGDTVYFASVNGSLFAVDRQTGNTRWNKSFEGKFYAGPIAAGDSILLAPYGIDVLLMAVDTNGNQVWAFTPAKK
ncbi:MAG: PQQ-binding-like beta-propeller repeat protein [Chloroflexota bacterium]